MKSCEIPDQPGRMEAGTNETTVAQVTDGAPTLRPVSGAYLIADRLPNAAARPRTTPGRRHCVVESGSMEQRL